MSTPSALRRGPSRRRAAQQGEDHRASPDRPSVLVLSGSVGAGHDGAAHELAERLRRRGADVEVEDYLEALPRWFAALLRDGYSLSVERVPGVFQWVFSSLERSSAAQRVMTACCRWAERRVLAWIARRPYAAVVSTYPLASQTLGQLRADGRLRVPAVTYLTDPAAHRSWVHASVDLHLTVTSATAVQGQLHYGVPMQPAGPLVPDRFSDPLPPGRASALREELGLPARRAVVLLSSGSLGLGSVEDAVGSVLRAGLTPLVLCGSNARLRVRLARRPGVVAVGWRQDVHELMQIVDVLVHNAGGLTFTESLVAGLPAVSYRCIPGHGLANAEVLEQAGLAPWAQDEASFILALQRQVRAGRRRRPVFADPSEVVAGLVRPSVVLPVRDTAA